LTEWTLAAIENYFERRLYLNSVHSLVDFKSFLAFGQKGETPKRSIHVYEFIGAENCLTVPYPRIGDRRLGEESPTDVDFDIGREPP
jgi:hypothetical protein